MCIRDRLSRIVCVACLWFLGFVVVCLRCRKGQRKWAQSTWNLRHLIDWYRRKQDRCNNLIGMRYIQGECPESSLVINRVVEPLCRWIPKIGIIGESKWVLSKNEANHCACIEGVIGNKRCKTYRPHKRKCRCILYTGLSIRDERAGDVQTMGQEYLSGRHM